MKRRQVIKLGAAAGAAVMLGGPGMWAVRGTPTVAAYNSTGLKKFAQPLRGVGPGGIPVAAPDPKTAKATGAIHYTLDIAQFKDTLHPDLGATTLWGYNPTRALGVKGTVQQKHLGGIIVAQKGVPIQLTFTNKLPNSHILPVDTTELFADAALKYGGSGVNAASTHLHGGFVPWVSDGGPMAWFTPAASGGHYGPSIANGTQNFFKDVLNPDLQLGQAEYYYPNQQSARMMWYHDHAHDITRLNAYAGIATAYILRDEFEAGLVGKGLPEFIEKGGKFELPIVIQDKVFVGGDLAKQDPDWPKTCPSTPGSLWYPHIYDADVDPSQTEPIPDPSCVPEMFGDTMLANGTVYPEAKVEARRYRLRILNACQSRFLNLQLYVDDGSKDGITLDDSFNPTNAGGPDFLVIGAEGGFLAQQTSIPSNRPLVITQRADDPDAYLIEGGSLLTAPAERWDVVVDFGLFAGKKLILYNDAPAPFPGGDSTTDFFPGAPENPTQPQPGFGPNTRQIMRFNVVKATGKDAAWTVADSDLRAGLDAFFVEPTTAATATPAVGDVMLTGDAVAQIRTLTLNEESDAPYGRLIQRLGTNETVFDSGLGVQVYGRNYMDLATETPKAGTTEVWEIVNTTGDTHPIHFHLANVQILSRQLYQRDAEGLPIFDPITGRIVVKSTLSGPDKTELGWKETVKMNPGDVTTVIMKFALPTVLDATKVPIEMPTSLNPDLGVTGYEYVWHCHILEHEEHDMMRPMVVIP